MNHDTHYNCKLQYDTVRFCTSSDNISLIKGKENLFKHTFDIETGEVTSMEFNSQANQANRNIVPFSLYIRVNMQSKRMIIEFCLYRKIPFHKHYGIWRDWVSANLMWNLSLRIAISISSMPPKTWIWNSQNPY